MRSLVSVCVLALVSTLPSWPLHAAKGKAVDTTAPTITHEPPGACPDVAAPAPTTPETTPPTTPAPPTTTTEPVPCLIVAGIADESGVFDPTLLFRLKGGAAFDRVPMKPMGADQPGRYEAVVPAAVATAGDVEYLIEAFDVEGNGPARAGTEAGPLLLTRKAVVVVVPPVVVVPEDNTGLVIGVVAGVAAAVAVAVGVSVAIYALRPPASDVIAVTVEGPAPFAAAVLP
ncbi:MAG: hypothetical protein Q8O67_19720 [Deltaproteobacteria bacterium]|nr:hypothetical protein [Deltaproteobacteria bacterium]